MIFSANCTYLQLHFAGRGGPAHGGGVLLRRVPGGGRVKHEPVGNLGGEREGLDLSRVRGLERQDVPLERVASEPAGLEPRVAVVVARHSRVGLAAGHVRARLQRRQRRGRVV